MTPSTSSGEDRTGPLVVKVQATEGRVRGSAPANWPSRAAPRNPPLAGAAEAGLAATIEATTAATMSTRRELVIAPVEERTRTRREASVAFMAATYGYGGRGGAGTGRTPLRGARARGGR